MNYPKYTLLLCFIVYLVNGTILDTYTQLQKNPGFRKMTLLEIAIDRGDFEAIRYFEFRANLDELKRGRRLLQSKVATYDAIIQERREEFLKPEAEKVPTLIKVEDARRLKAVFESLLKEFDRKIESTEKELEIKESAKKLEAVIA